MRDTKRVGELLIYWGAPLFVESQRIWNRSCAQHLRGIGYRVVLPQDESKKVIDECGGLVNNELTREIAKAIAENCRMQCKLADVGVFVLDGADPGTAMEAGIKLESIGNTGRGLAIGVSTEIRPGDIDGADLMFLLLHEIIVWPGYNEGHRGMCNLLHEVIQRLWAKCGYETVATNPSPRGSIFI